MNSSKDGIVFMLHVHPRHNEIEEAAGPFCSSSSIPGHVFLDLPDDLLEYAHNGFIITFLTRVGRHELFRDINIEVKDLTDAVYWNIPMFQFEFKVDLPHETFKGFTSSSGDPGYLVDLKYYVKAELKTNDPPDMVCMKEVVIRKFSSVPESNPQLTLRYEFGHNTGIVAYFTKTYHKLGEVLFDGVITFYSVDEDPSCYRNVRVELHRILKTLEVVSGGLGRNCNWIDDKVIASFECPTDYGFGKRHGIFPDLTFGIDANEECQSYSVTDIFGVRYVMRMVIGLIEEGQAVERVGCEAEIFLYRSGEDYSDGGNCSEDHGVQYSDLGDGEDYSDGEYSDYEDYDEEF